MSTCFVLDSSDHYWWELGF